MRPARWINAGLCVLFGGAVGFVVQRAIDREEALLEDAARAVSGQAPDEASMAPLSILDVVQQTSSEDLGELLWQHHDDVFAYRLIATRWASLDPLGLGALIDAIEFRDSKRDPFREELETILYRVWSRADSEAAFAYAIEHPSNDYWGFWGLDKLVAETAETDFDQALSMVSRANHLVTRFDRGTWMDADPPTFLPKIASLPMGSWKNSALQLVYKEWGMREPRAALSFYTAQDYGDPFHENGIALANAALGEDPEAALQWATQQENQGIHLVLQAAANAAEARNSAGERPTD